MRSFARLAALGVLLLGVAGLVFGILLVVAGTTTTSETVKELQDDHSPTEIGQLRTIRENFRDLRWAIDPPPQDPNNEDSLNVLILETGTGLTLTNLGMGRMITLAGIGNLVLGAGLILVGFMQYRMAGRMT